MVNFCHETLNLDVIKDYFISTGDNPSFLVSNFPFCFQTVIYSKDLDKRNKLKKAKKPTSEDCGMKLTPCF